MKMSQDGMETEGDTEREKEKIISLSLKAEGINSCHIKIHICAVIEKTTAMTLENINSQPPNNTRRGGLISLPGRAESRRGQQQKCASKMQKEITRKKRGGGGGERQRMNPLTDEIVTRNTSVTLTTSCIWIHLGDRNPPSLFLAPFSLSLSVSSPLNTHPLIAHCPNKPNNGLSKYQQNTSSARRQHTQPGSANSSVVVISCQSTTRVGPNMAHQKHTHKRGV